MNDKTRLRLSFTISSDYVTIAKLRDALSEDRGKWWIRHALGDELERVLRWCAGGDHWRVRVEGGALSVVEEGDAKGEG